MDIHMATVFYFNTLKTIQKNMSEHQIRLDISQTSEVVCDACGNNCFVESLLIRKVPGLAMGSSQPQYAPLPVFSCTKCGGVNVEFLPPQLKEKPVPEKKEGKVISILSHDRP